MSLANHETTIFEKKDFVAHITLNRPNKKNALNDQMIKDLKEIFHELYTDTGVKVVVIKGAGDIFCSGADLAYLKLLKKNTYDENLKDSKSLAELFIQIAELPKPTIALVQGAALAGGCGLATACDFIYADDQTIFGYPEVKIGFVAAIVSIFLIKQVGERKARELLLSGNTISAKEAKNIGLVTNVFSRTELAEEVNILCNSLIRNSAQAMASTKALFKSYKNDILALAEVNAKSRETADFNEGLSAFLDKRKPSWII